MRFLYKFKWPLFLIGLLLCILIIWYFLPKPYLHGQELLNLPDPALLKTVQAQNLSIVKAAPNEAEALKNMDSVHKTVYVLSVFENEIRGGGLCLFFVNETRSVAPYVSQALSAVGANEHLALFSEFIQTNNIDLTNLGSFAIKNIEEYAQQEKRYDFTTFDTEYYSLPSLNQRIAAFVRDNIDSF